MASRSRYTDPRDIAQMQNCCRNQKYLLSPLSRRADEENRVVMNYLGSLVVRQKRGKRSFAKKEKIEGFASM